MSKREKDVEFVEDGEPSHEKTVDIKKLKEELAKAKKERGEYLDGWQRAKADFINTKKRLEGEVEEAFERGVLDTVHALLPALDSLESALEHTNDEGLRLVKKQCLEALALEPFDPTGEPFDPLRHEPMGTVPADDNTKEDTVAQVLQKGYSRKGVIIRPAKVHVAT